MADTATAIDKTVSITQQLIGSVNDPTIPGMLKQFAEKTQEIVTQYGPQVLDSMFGAIRLNAVFNLTVDFLTIMFFCIIGQILFYISRYCWVEFKKNEYSDWDCGAWATYIIGCVVTYLFSSMVIWNIPLSTWICAYDPRYGLMFIIFKKSLGLN